MIYLGSDHAGFNLKRRIAASLAKTHVPYTDVGPFALDPEDDYPDYCIAVAEAVSRHKGSKGVVIGGSGIGEAIAANKVKGVRAALVYDTFTAKKSREHNDANVIALRGRGVTPATSLRLLKVWLATRFSGGARHVRRINKITRYERR
ncbi:MAG: ribose-5-phosphate isomerase [Nanoarchaeota archaeon]